MLCWLIGGMVVAVPVLVVMVAWLLIATIARPFRRASFDAVRATHRHGGIVQDHAREPEALRTQGLAGSAMAELRRERLAKASATQRLEICTTLLMDLNQIAALLITVGVVGVGAVLALDGQLTTGGLGAVTILASRAGTALIAAASALVRRGLSAEAYRELRALMPRTPETAAPDEGRNPPGLQLARAGQTLTIEPGSMVVLDGASIEEDERAFAAITDAIWPEGQVDHPWAVTLLRDGHARAPGSVGGAVLVPTYPVLFSGTILENLTLFDEGRTEAALSLSRQLGLEAKVGRLAQGYRTPVGSEARPVLSPGVVKRVALVRALAQRPTLLLLDRPAVSLDREGVAALAALLAEAPRGMTVVMTTHAEPLRAVAHVLLPLEARSQPAEAA